MKTIGSSEIGGRTHTPASAGQPSFGPPPERQKILIVDDKRENLVTLRQVLRDVDVDIVEATNGNEALAATLEHEFALAILDVMMPGMNGFELAEFLRGDEKTRVIPIVFVTASLMDERSEFKGYEAGGIDYIIKPYAPDVMLGKVQLFLEMDRYKRELRQHRDHLQELVGERTAALNERVKELRCLNGISSLAVAPDQSVDGLLRAAVRLLPAGWQYPEITCARITFEGQVFETSGFKESQWKQTADILLSGERAGNVVVCYLAERPLLDEGPFLKEEGILIEDVARQLAIIIGRYRAEARTEHLNRVLRAIRNVNQLIVHEKDPRKLIQIACDSLIETRGYNGTWIALSNGGDDPDTIAQAGWADAFQPFQHELEEGNWPSCRQELLAHDDSVLVLSPDATCKACPLAQAYEHGVGVIAELRHKEESYGMMGVSFPRDVPIDQEEKDLLEEVAGDIAFALHDIEIEGQRNRYAQIVASSTEAMALVDAQFVYLEANPSYRSLVGQSDSDIVGRRISDVVGNTFFRDTLKPHLDRCLGGEEVKFEATRKVAGDVRYVEALSTPCQSKDGSVSAVAVCIRDITERKKAEKEREEIRGQLVQAQKLEAIGTLAGGVAHEINNPINAVMNYAQLIIDRSDGDSTFEEFGKEIISESERVASIVRNLLSFARMEKDTSFRSTGLADIVESTLSLIRTVIRHDRIILDLKLPQDLPRILCRGQQLQQVILNLVTNARDAVNAKFSNRHPDKTIRISAHTRRDNDMDWVRLTVEDHGSGIPEEVRSRIFDPFFTTKHSSDGTGLGLSISHGIIKEHGGEVHIETREGEWTRVHIDLPVAEGSYSSGSAWRASGERVSSHEG